MSELVEIVASFPFPPKQFYENLTEEEILNIKPPSLPSNEIETLLIFGNEQVKFSLKCVYGFMVLFFYGFLWFYFILFCFVLF